MGHRANYTFKFKNQYINNVYQHWGAMSGSASAIAEMLFDESKNFENMEDVANFIVKNDLLELYHFYNMTKKHNFENFLSGDEQESFVEKVKDNLYVFDSELILIDYHQEFCNKEGLENYKYVDMNDENCKYIDDVVVHYLLDIDNKELKEIYCEQYDDDDKTDDFCETIIFSEDYERIVK